LDFIQLSTKLTLNGTEIETQDVCHSVTELTEASHSLRHFVNPICSFI